MAFSPRISEQREFARCLNSTSMDARIYDLIN